MAISAISNWMISITYKRQNHRFRVFRQSLRIHTKSSKYRYLDILIQDPTSQIKKQGLRILSIISFHPLLLDHRLNAPPERLPAYMRAPAFYSCCCCHRQIQIKWLIRPKIFFSSLLSIFAFCRCMKLGFKASTITINIWNRPLLSIIKSGGDTLRNYQTSQFYRYERVLQDF